MSPVPVLARTDTQPASVGISRLEDLVDTSGQGVQGGDIDPGAHDDELVATDAGDDIRRPHDLAQTASDLDQDLVTDGVTVCVVDLFEVVEVDEHGAESVAPSRRGASRRRPSDRAGCRPL